MMSEPDCYEYFPPLPGENGAVSADLTDEIFNRADYEGTPVVLIHSHNNPDEENGLGYMLSEEDYEWADRYHIDVVYTADGDRGSCQASWNPNERTGEGNCDQMGNGNGNGVPEIDLASAGGALTLLVGFLALMGERRRRAPTGA